jgi:hypothetical protein
MEQSQPSTESNMGQPEEKDGLMMVFDLYQGNTASGPVLSFDECPLTLKGWYVHDANTSLIGNSPDLAGAGELRYADGPGREESRSNH